MNHRGSISTSSSGSALASLETDGASALRPKALGWLSLALGGERLWGAVGTIAAIGLLDLTAAIMQTREERARLA